jgi:sec-independent protein translocase protein TatB
MFDIAWSELLVIMVVALVVIGPKDLPRAMRVAGQWMRRARALASQFQGTVDAMVREAEMEEMRRELQKARREMDTFSTDPGTIPPAGPAHVQPAEIVAPEPETSTAPEAPVPEPGQEPVATPSPHPTAAGGSAQP